MSSPRYFVSGLRLGGTYLLSKEDTHHAKDVIRLGSGDSIVAVDPGSESEYLSVVTTLGDLLEIKTIREIERNQASSPVSTLIAALLKGGRDEQIADWAVELGVRRLIFFEADRSVVKVKDPENRTTRLSRITEGSAKQSKKSFLPSVHVLPSLDEALSLARGFDTENSPLKLSCSLSPQALPLKNCLIPEGGPVHLVIGPEGDFTSREENLLISEGYKLVSLGPWVLRAELAALTGIIQVQALF